MISCMDRPMGLNDDVKKYIREIIACFDQVFTLSLWN